MFRNLPAFLLAFIAFNAQAREHLPVTDTFRMPAEWEKHEAVWVGWELFAPFHQPSLSVIRELLPFVPVRVVTESRFSTQVAKEWLHLQGVDSSKPAFFVMPDNRIWIRDHGATFLRNDKGELGFADLTWSHYGIRDWLKWVSPPNSDIETTYRQAAKRTGSVDSLMGFSQSAHRIATDISLEGGGIEVNGKGVLILSESVTLQRNPGKTKQYIESELRRVLGVNIIIWMKQGLADDPHIIRQITGKYFGFGTGGHTDEFVRFVNDSTILLAWVEESEKDANPIHRMNFDRMSENLRILEEARDQRGRPFRIILVPLPDLVYKNVLISHWQKNESDDAILSAWLNPQSGFKAGDTVRRVAAASYLNYFVTNGVVLVPTYLGSGSSPVKEQKVRAILEEAFPGRKIIFIDVMALNYEGGGIHCITQQQPF